MFCFYVRGYLSAEIATCDLGALVSSGSAVAV
jgi:hypothetical protein